MHVSSTDKFWADYFQKDSVQQSDELKRLLFCDPRLKKLPDDLYQHVLANLVRSYIQDAEKYLRSTVTVKATFQRIGDE